MDEKKPSPDERYAQLYDKTHLEVLEELHRGEIGYAELPESQVENYLMGQTVIIVGEPVGRKYEVITVNMQLRTVGLKALTGKAGYEMVPLSRIRMYAVLEDEVRRRIEKLQSMS